MERLALANLEGLPTGVVFPSYAFSSLGIGVVHLGLGAFHRAHQACFTDAAIASQGGDWGICGVSLRSPTVRDTLAPQQGLYTVAVRQEGILALQVVGVIRECLVAPETPAAVIARLADPAVHVVTLTITEKGYGLNHATGNLDPTQPDLAHDLSYPTAPRTALGYLAGGLAARRAKGCTGLTLLSCDNLTANGHKLRAALLAFCQLVDADLAEWVAQSCTFPCSMVDRIVPSTTDADRDAVAQGLGLRDEACVLTEPFSQWVIEEKFAGPVPAWDRVGAQFVPEVAPFEEMKLRQLNASHSTLAYLAAPAGIDTVAAAVALPAMRSMLRELMVLETAPTLTGLGEFDLAAYQDQLLLRFANRGLQHRTRQIATDGSQKIPQRLLPALRWQLANAGDYRILTLGIAAWVRYTRGVDEQGESYLIDDPLADKLARCHGAAGPDPARYLASVLAVEEVFPADLADDDRVQVAVLDWLQQLETHGALATLSRHWGGS